MEEEEELEVLVLIRDVTWQSLPVSMRLKSTEVLFSSSWFSTLSLTTTVETASPPSLAALSPAAAAAAAAEDIFVVKNEAVEVVLIMEMLNKAFFFLLCLASMISSKMAKMVVQRLGLGVTVSQSVWEV